MGPYPRWTLSEVKSEHNAGQEFANEDEKMDRVGLTSSGLKLTTRDCATSRCRYGKKRKKKTKGYTLRNSKHHASFRTTQHNGTGRQRESFTWHFTLHNLTQSRTSPSFHHSITTPRVTSHRVACYPYSVQDTTTNTIIAAAPYDTTLRYDR